jgi:hypothetical protein
VASGADVAFSPNLKILGCVVLGYIITKQGLFTAASAKGVSILSLVRVGLVSGLTPECVAPRLDLFLHCHRVYSGQYLCVWLARRRRNLVSGFRGGFGVAHSRSILCAP